MSDLDPGSGGAQRANWVIGILIATIGLLAFLFWLGVQLGYIDVIAKVSHG